MKSKPIKKIALCIIFLFALILIGIAGINIYMLFGNVQCEAYIPRQENTDNWKCKRLMGFLKITPPGRSKDSKAGLFLDNRKID